MGSLPLDCSPRNPFVLPATSRFSDSLCRISPTLSFVPSFYILFNRLVLFVIFTGSYILFAGSYIHFTGSSCIWLLLPFTGPARWLLYVGPVVRGSKGGPEGVRAHARSRSPAQSRRVRALANMMEYERGASASFAWCCREGDRGICLSPSACSCTPAPSFLVSSLLLLAIPFPHAK